MSECKEDVKGLGIETQGKLYTGRYMLTTIRSNNNNNNNNNNITQLTKLTNAT
jgi:hypothetical protein